MAGPQNMQSDSIASGAATGAVTGGPWGAAIGAGLGIAGSLFGADQAAKERAAAERARQQALALYSGISVPEIEQMMINLGQYQNVGSLDPALEQLVGLGPTAMEGISSDPRLRDQQVAALEGISGLASGQPTQADLAGFELARQNSAAEMQARNNQVLQDMQQRGQGGSGAELIAKLTNNQSGTQMLQKAQLEQAQAMQQARMQALQQQAGMAGNLREQDYGEAANLAKARDAIAQFNAQNAQGVNSRNTGTRNDASKYNLTNQQNTANMNTETQNKQQIHNKGLHQGNFNNQMTLANAKSNIMTGQAAAADKNAADTASMWATIGQGAGGVAKSLLDK